MGLESPTYISDLVSTNPTTGDPKNEGDDHIRNIKSAIKATFPNVSGAVAPTHTELNYVDGVTSAIQTQFNQLKPSWTTVSSTPYSAADGGWYLVRTNSSAIEIDLPAGSTGAIIRVKDADGAAGTRNITLDPNGSELIENLSAGEALVMDTDYSFVTLQYLNSAWRIIGL